MLSGESSIIPLNLFLFPILFAIIRIALKIELKRIAEKNNKKISKIGYVKVGNYEEHIRLTIDNKEERLEKNRYNHLSR
ncbi:hypothetical protein [Oceanobacillus chungangensis]|uniref:Uncharacterized protein n=1 Tax=Oceanobacillus chungangensis TaxID=1229152 RepID=A0A3D8PU41_9BACI|nr:hypothetical protein [Oceanobacillus chungangensis]RDW18821.1 hypothetical protein CWR45_08315 [Oceanobacillus chungangensis]